MRRSKVYLRLCERVDALDVFLICKDTRGEARDDFFGVEEMGAVEDVLVDEYVFAEEGRLVNQR